MINVDNYGSPQVHYDMRHPVIVGPSPRSGIEIEQLWATWGINCNCSVAKWHGTPIGPWGHHGTPTAGMFYTSLQIIITYTTEYHGFPVPLKWGCCWVYSALRQCFATVSGIWKPCRSSRATAARRQFCILSRLCSTWSNKWQER